MLKCFFNQKFKTNIIDLLPKVRGKYIKDAPMSKHTWFAVGGPAEVMYLPEDEADLASFFKHVPENIPITVIGSGSNLLVRDGGIPGVVIKLDSPHFKRHILNDDRTLTCYAGKKNIELKKVLLDNELGGLEFLCSIPGAIGGCVKTNAGCYGKEVKDVILSAKIIDRDGEEKTIDVADLQLGYRTSLFPDDWIVISITFKTEKSSRAQIQEILDKNREHRIRSQPYNERTAGSTFKNPPGLKAWELIKKSGADKLTYGGAKVSEKHCNFLINTGNACARDIEKLGEAIIKLVKEKTSITLEWEVKRLGIKK